MSVRRHADLLRRGWRLHVAGLLVMAAFAVVIGTGLAQAFGNVTVTSIGVPLAAPLGTLDPAT